MNKMVSTRQPFDTAGLDFNAFRWFCLPIMIFGALQFVGVDWLDGLRLGDVDDVLRSMEIHQLWKSGSWYDLTLPMIRMPEAYVSPWSRLVDLPYVAIAGLLSRFVNGETALQRSFLIWPPMMLAAFCSLAFDIVRRLRVSERSTKTYVALMMVLFMFPMYGEFSPGRIDHHNVQILLLALMLTGVMRFSVAGGIVTGIGAALSVAVGLECLPIIVAIYGALTALWLFGAAGSRRVLSATMLSTAIALTLVGLAFVGPIGLSSIRCDTLSAPYIYLVGATSLAAGLVAALVGDTAAKWRKFVLLFAPGIVICAGFALMFPGCVAGPYAIIDPVSLHFWFARIQQEQNALVLFRYGSVAQVVILVIHAFVLLLALPMVVSLMRRGRVQETILYAAALACFLMTLMLVRFANFSVAFVPLLLPLAIDRIFLAVDDRHSRQSTLSLSAAVIAPVGIVMLLFVQIPRDVRPLDTIDYMNGDDCARGDLSRLSELQPGLILAPPGLSMTIASQGPAGLSVAGIPFHRASPGLRRTYLAFTSADEATRRDALAPFDYLAVCRVKVPLDAEQAPLYVSLASGGSWPGLIAIGGDERQPLQLFRIDHDRLR